MKKKSKKADEKIEKRVLKKVTKNLNVKKDSKKTSGKKKETVEYSKKDRWSEESKKSNGKEQNAEKNASQRIMDKKQDKSSTKASVKSAKSKASECKLFDQCGGCQHLDKTYENQLKIKQKQVETLLKSHCKVNQIVGMENPYHYRNKVHAVFSRDQRGNIISGVYKEGTHHVVPVETCLIEDQKADEIIGTIRSMLRSFKIKTYDEDTGYGLLRYVLVKRGFTSNEIMVVLVIGSPIFPSKNNFVKALREKHPEITTVIINVNDRSDSMILGNKETTIYGKGYIEDTLCGNVFRISSKSFYQVNPVQTEILYSKAIESAKLTGKETVVDAYCGIGTIGLVAAKHAKEVIGVELNKDAYKDAIANAKRNEIKNVRFFNADASEFMVKLAREKKKVDVVLMDPPRSGSTEVFIDAVAMLAPKRVVYVSCNPITLERDLKYFEKMGYEAKEAWPVDMFPWVSHVETIVLLTKK